jgi:hypothetical protein
VSAKAVLAHAALETGWGQHLPRGHDGASSNNLFGIKAGASWTGDSVSVPTLEYDGDVARRAQSRFRAYASPEASFEDYATLTFVGPRTPKDGAAMTPYAAPCGPVCPMDYARKLEEPARGEQMKAASRVAPNDGAGARATGAQARHHRSRHASESFPPVFGLLDVNRAVQGRPQHPNAATEGYVASASTRVASGDHVGNSSSQRRRASATGAFTTSSSPASCSAIPRR